ncbi:MAG TPA: ATP-binding cassette domain-containing protein [Syntrophobacteria bacterium]|nr:ATP-binding cassette domain-containing protein [Syntrophobacteria bacterium]
MGIPVLACEQIEYGDQGRPAFAGVTFHLEAGERLVILADPRHHGEILLRICATLTPPTGGRISWWGRSNDEIREPERYELRRRIGLVCRRSSLISNLTLLDNVTLGLQYYENLSREAAYDRALTWLGRFGLAEHRSLRPADLSPTRRLLAVYARELVKSPEMLVLESPFFDLDGGYRDLLADAVDEARRACGCALVVADVDPGRAKSWGERVLILQGGRGRTVEAGEFDPVLYAASAQKGAEDLSMERSMA